jgi:hypothetical protein
MSWVDAQDLALDVVRLSMSCRWVECAETIPDGEEDRCRRLCWEISWSRVSDAPSSDMER